MNSHARTILQAKLAEEKYKLTIDLQQVQNCDQALEQAKQEVSATRQRVAFLEEALGE